MQELLPQQHQMVFFKRLTTRMTPTFKTKALHLFSNLQCLQCPFPTVYALP